MPQGESEWEWAGRFTVSQGPTVPRAGTGECAGALARAKSVAGPLAPSKPKLKPWPDCSVVGASFQHTKVVGWIPVTAHKRFNQRMHK